MTVKQLCREMDSREFAEWIELNFRFVVADNGSTDGSPSVLEQLGRRDSAVIALANR
jgi:glycosyltransferase involved in cell wall biosynthesis